MSKYGFGLAMACLALGCGGGETTTDAGVDGGTSVLDTGTGAIDAPMSDVGATDSGSPTDAGAPDAGTDAGPVGDAEITFAPTCPSFAPCTGAIQGTWNYQSICIENHEVLDPIEPTCAGTELISGGGSAAGVVTITASNISRMITTAVSVELSLGTSCTVICPAAAGIITTRFPGSTAACAVDTADSRCHCDITFTSVVNESRPYIIDGDNTLVTGAGTMGERRFEYCAMGTTLRYREVGGEPGVSTSMME